MALATAAAFVLTRALIPRVAPRLLDAGLSGADLNKGTKGKTPIPEALGLVSGFVFLMAATVLIGLVPQDENDVREGALAGLVSVSFMLLLGFTDDVLNLRWRYKLVLPIFAALPIVSVYSGSTCIPCPSFLKNFLGGVLGDIGGFYNIGLLILALFAGNSINIYAGINGIEVGQTLVAGAAVAVRALMKGEKGPVLLILPFLGASLGLFCHNRYPAKCFVGDTFTYSAGMVLMAAATVGCFPLELLFYMLPELLNFLISLPQLLGIIPCPRHRLPHFDEASGLLVGVPEHLTLINCFLRLRGPLREDRVCYELLVIQIVWEVIILFVASRGWLDWLHPESC